MNARIDSVLKAWKICRSGGNLGSSVKQLIVVMDDDR